MTKLLPDLLAWDEQKQATSHHVGKIGFKNAKNYNPIPVLRSLL